MPYPAQIVGRAECKVVLQVPSEITKFSVCVSRVLKEYPFARCMSNFYCCYQRLNLNNFLKLERASHQLNGQWHSPPSHTNPRTALPSSQLWDVISMIVLLEIKSGQHRNCHFSFTVGPLIPFGVYLFQVKNTSPIAYIYPVEYFFLFFSIRDQIRVVSSVVISYHQQTSQPTLYVCSYKNHQPSLLHNDHSQ